MRVRHRIPSIFNLSMVDVLCCALGCVILLWLINLREAKHHEESAEEQNRRITARLDVIRAERDNIIGAMMRLESQIETVKSEKDDLQKSLSAKQTEAADLSRQLMTSSERVAALEKDLSDSEKRGAKEMARGRELAEKLTAANRRLKEMRTTANLVPGLRANLKEAKEQYAAEKALASALEKEIAKHQRDLKDANKNLEGLQATRRSLERDLDSREKELTSLRQSMASLQDEKKSLQGEAARVRAAAENRFAGITLTGRRVLFLVDMSGSMDLLDEKTQAPTKWTDVRNTVARLMRSLPDLEKYQVIVFAEKASYLLGGAGDWLDYDAKSSPQRVLDALAASKPKGGTNMYAALQAAFRLRPKGLDTIYLLSDGLPNLGEGLDPARLPTLRDVERNDILAKHIRRTLRSSWNRVQSGQPRVRINTVGFFYESPDVGAFLWALARENDGSFVGMSRP
jgi:predicted  nucleic acid-binding Zn-ribbon protein